MMLPGDVEVRPRYKYAVTDLPFPSLHQHWQCLGWEDVSVAYHPHLEKFCMDCSLLLPEGLAFDTVLFPFLCTGVLFPKVGDE